MLENLVLAFVFISLLLSAFYIVSFTLKSDEVEEGLEDEASKKFNL